MKDIDRVKKVLILLSSNNEIADSAIIGEDLGMDTVDILKVMLYLEGEWKQGFTNDEAFVPRSTNEEKGIKMVKDMTVSELTDLVVDDMKQGKIAELTSFNELVEEKIRLANIQIQMFKEEQNKILKELSELKGI